MRVKKGGRGRTQAGLARGGQKILHLRWEDTRNHRGDGQKAHVRPGGVNVVARARLSNGRWGGKRVKKKK